MDDINIRQTEMLNKIMIMDSLYDLREAMHNFEREAYLKGIQKEELHSLRILDWHFLPDSFPELCKECAKKGIVCNWKHSKVTYHTSTDELQKITFNHK